MKQTFEDSTNSNKGIHNPGAVHSGTLDTKDLLSESPVEKDIVGKALPINGILDILRELPSHSYFRDNRINSATGELKCLREWIETCNHDLKTLIAIAKDMANVIGQIHNLRIIHNKINSSTLFIEEKSLNVFLSDFSCAQYEWESRAPKTGEMNVREIAFMAPERTGRINQKIDNASDLYSLGIVLYELFTHELPFVSEDPLELIHEHLVKAPLDPGHLMPLLPPPLSQIIKSLLAKNQADRYQSAQGVEFDLDCCLELVSGKYGIEPPLFKVKSRDVDLRLDIPEKLYGREIEVDLLKDAFRVTCNGGASLVLVAGYSGIGKTKYVESLRGFVERANGVFIAGKFDQIQRSIPYWGFVQAFKGLAQSILSECDATLAAWKESITMALGENLQLIIYVLPELQWIVGIKHKDLDLGEIDPESLHNRFKLAIQNFIRLFCTKQKPLTIFLDDLQWVDAGTLNLIHFILSDRNCRHILVIGAYRNNEVADTHPLIKFKHQISNCDALFYQEVTLGPLTQDQISNLLVDMCHVQKEESFPLVGVIIDKTEGNPFFIGQFIKLLRYKELIWHEDGRWKWNLEGIRNLQISENVVDLMVSRLRSLPEKSQQMMSLAACMGSRFEIEGLSTAIQWTSHNIKRNLNPALEAGLILERREPSDLEGCRITYHFLHDRVQQAAYLMLSESEKMKAHLQIGNLLKKHLDNESLYQRLFEVTDHFNKARPIVTDDQQKMDIAILNAAAGAKARSAMACEASRKYYEIAFQLLPNGNWQCFYSFTFEIVCHLIESYYLTACYEKAQELCIESLQHAKTPLEKVKIYRLMCYNYTLQNRMQDTLETGVKALALLNIVPSRKPPVVTISQLRNLPEMTDPECLAAMGILVTITSCALVTQSKLMMPLIYTMIKLSATFGNCGKSAFGYVWYGSALCWQGKQISLGYRFGKLAIMVMETFRAFEIKTTVLHQFNSFILHWCDHEQLALKAFPEVVNMGRETGDIEYGSYVAVNYVTNLLLVGENLQTVQRKQIPYLEWVRQTKFSFSLTYGNIWAQLTQCLMGDARSQSLLSGDFLDEHRDCIKMRETKNNLNLFALFTAKAILQFTLGNFADCAASCQLAEPLEPSIGGLFPKTQVPFYGALALFQLFTPSTDNLKVLLKKTDPYLHKLKLWAQHGPMNFQHKYHLALAEKYRVLGRHQQALLCYNKAIQGAEQNKYIHEAALSYELAAKYFLGQGHQSFALRLAGCALAHYQSWGAQPKITHLLSVYPDLSSQVQFPYPNLDLISIVKSVRTLSENIVFEKLLERLLQIALENTGAQLGKLILKANDSWLIQAQAHFNADEVFQCKILTSVPFETDENLPLSLIRFVIHTHQSVILSSANTKGDFSKDSYIVKEGVRSILCQPLIYQGNLRGILYLENRIAVNVFSKDRRDFLDVLSSQMSVCLENAGLYASMEQTIALRTRQLEEAKIEADQARALAETANRAKSDFLATITHELRTPLNAIFGYAEILAQDDSISNAHRDGLGIIKSSCEHLNELISDVMDLAKIESGVIEVNHESFDIFETLETLIEILLPGIRNKGITLDSTIESTLPQYVVGDRKKIRHIVLNLINNSLKFTDKGGIDFRVSHRKDELSQNKENVIMDIEVQDTGIGIPASRIKDIFEPYVQINNVNQERGGTGLGLAICHSLITAMSGSLSVQSILHQGTTIKVSIPLMIDNTQNKALLYAKTKPDLEPSGAHGIHRVLIIEDNMHHRNLLQTMLTSYGFKVMVASCGTSGIKIFKSWKPNLIWMDLRMKGLDGYQTTRIIRDLPDGNSTKIIAVTATSFVDQKSEILGKGFDDVLLKPFKSNDVFEMMGRHLESNFCSCESNNTDSCSDREQLKQTIAQVLPKDLVKKLVQAIEELDLTEIHLCIAQISTCHAGLANALKRRIDNFEYLAILNLLQQGVS